MKITWNPDWPEYDSAKRSWDLAAPTDDLVYGFESYLEFVDTNVPAQNMEPFAADDIAQIVSYHVAYHGSVWTPGEGGGSELEMVILGRLRDGRWFTGSLWNDYTGWGCRDGVRFVIGDSVEAVMARGLDERERNLLDAARNVRLGSTPARDEALNHTKEGL